MKNNLVLTIATGGLYDQVKKLTHPSIQKYANKIKADFLVIENSTTADPNWEKTQVHTLLNKYKRILLLDSDLIIRSDCPNLFEIVPEDKLGGFNEKRFFQSSERIKLEDRKSVV